MVMRKTCASSKVSMIGGSPFLIGKSMINFVRAKPFLVLQVANSTLNYGRITIHF